MCIEYMHVPFHNKELSNYLTKISYLNKNVVNNYVHFMLMVIKFNCKHDYYFHYFMIYVLDIKQAKIFTVSHCCKIPSRSYSLKSIIGTVDCCMVLC